MLTTFKNNCIANASRLGDYQKMEVTPLADGYCAALEAGNDKLAESFMSALILRYWYKIGRLYKENPSLNLGYDDYADLLYERIDYACKYQAWKKGGTCTNASQAIQQSIGTGIKNLYYFANLDKNSANYNNISLDAALDSDDDDESSKDWLESKLVEKEKDFSSAEQVIQSYLDRNKIVQAIILDTIAFGDSCRESKETATTTVINNEGEEETVKYSKYYHQFVKFGVVKVLNSLPTDYQQYFLDKYVVGKDLFEAGLNTIKKANNQKLYRYLAKVLEELKANPSVLELLLN